MTKKNLNLLIGLIILLVSIYFKPAEKNSHTLLDAKSDNLETPKLVINSATDSATLFRVARVIDGDTIELANGNKVRYIGVNTPETVAPGKPTACYGHEASEKNKEMVLGHEVVLEKDISETDKYGRLLRYVYVDNVMVNNELVKNGYAQVSTYPPDVKYQNLFLESQKHAKENNLGLWTNCIN